MIRFLIFFSFILFFATNNWAQKSLSIAEATSLAQFYNFQFYPDSALTIIKGVPEKNLITAKTDVYTSFKMQEAYAYIWRIDYESYDSLRQKLILDLDDFSSKVDTLRFKLLDAVLCAVQKKFVIGDSIIRSVLMDYKEVHKQEHPDSLIWKPYLGFFGHFGLSDYNKTPENYSKAINIINEVYPQRVNLSYALEMLLAIYFNFQADTNNGLVRINRTIQDCRSNPQCRNRLFPIMTVWKTDFLFSIDSIGLGLQTIQQGFDISSTAYQKAKTSDMLGEAYARLSIKDSVYTHYDRARSLLFDLFGPDPDYFSTSDCYGRSLHRIGDDAKMMTIHEELESYEQPKYPTAYNGNIRIIEILYRNFLSQGKLDTALHYYNLWLSRSRFRGKPISGWGPPDSKAFYFHGADPIYLMNKAKLGLLKYKQSPDNNYDILISAKETCMLSDSIFNSLMQLNINAISRLRIIKGFSEFNDTFIKIFNDIYKTTKDPQDLSNLLYAIDRSHDLDLWVSINDSKISKNNNALNTLLLRQDSIMRKLIKFKERKDQFNGLEQALYETELTIKKKTQTKGELIDRSIYDFSISEFDGNNEQILMYHYNKRKILCLYYDGHDWHFFEKVLDFNLDQKILSFRRNITEPFLPCDSCQTNQTFNLENDIAFFQNLLIPKALDHQAYINIIPDKHLSLLPFDILLTKNKEIVDYSFQYSLSSMRHLKLNNEQIHEKQYVLMSNFEQKSESFVDYETYRGGNLGLLKYAGEEQQSVHKHLINSSVFDCISADQLEMYLGYADILHLISHAKQSLKDNKNSYIAVNEDDDCSKTNYISHEQLDFMKTDARLVVLSACETGIGQYISGEGIHSFSKTLIGNGAKSVVSSLWQVNDRSTSIIINYFYDYLSQGFTKSRALIQAKQDYLNSVDIEFQHPYYWAGLQLFGNNQAILSKSIDMKQNIYFLLVGLVIILFGFIYFYSYHN